MSLARVSGHPIFPLPICAKRSARTYNQNTAMKILFSVLTAALVFSPVFAFAAHNSVDFIVSEPQDCSFSIETEWSEQGHEVGNTVLVVLADGTVTTYPIGTIAEIEEQVDVVQWRIWGGGERDYDNPVLDDLSALVAYLDKNQDNTPVDAAAPGVAWFEVELGCEPVPTPTPTASSSKASGFNPIACAWLPDHPLCPQEPTTLEQLQQTLDNVLEQVLAIQKALANL